MFHFSMTKKSSFLRQLNLYGFNRLSGSGPDQGSYCKLLGTDSQTRDLFFRLTIFPPSTDHPMFLRGLKFLCRRMQRIKVNGNGIRAAGNPDEEPNFALFCSCPPAPTIQPRAATFEQEDLDGHHNSDTGQRSLPSLQSEPHPEISPSAGAAGDGNTGRVYKPLSAQQHSFPLRLQRMLDKLEAEGKGDIVSWLPHGRAFMVHDPERFVEELMPVYFNQTKYSSFQRQLHMYNFSRITTGRDKGAYWNCHFQRGKPSLTVHMPRTRVNGKGTRRYVSYNAVEFMFTLTVDFCAHLKYSLMLFTVRLFQKMNQIYGRSPLCLQSNRAQLFWSQQCREHRWPLVKWHKRLIWRTIQMGQIKNICDLATIIFLLLRHSCSLKEFYFHPP